MNKAAETTTDDFLQERDDLDLLKKTKDQYRPGAMRPHLCEVFAQFGNKLPKTSIQWQYNAGMGDTVLHPADQRETEAARRLMAKGWLVPTWEDSTSFYDKFYQLTHFDDLNWARSEDGQIVLYRFVNIAHEPEYPDAVIDASERPQALQEFRKRTQYTPFLEDEPIRLKGFGDVYPILLNPHAIELRRRQVALKI